MSITQKVHKISLIVDAQTNQLRRVGTEFKLLEREIARVTGKVDLMATTFKANEAKMQQSIIATSGVSKKHHRSMTNEIVRHIRQVETLIVAFYTLKKAYDVTIGMGHEFNKMMESEKIGMALIISERLKHTDATGKAVSAMDRWIYAQQMSKKVMEDVREINVSTPHTLQETTQIYKTMAGQILAYGGTLQQVKEATLDVSVVSKAMNVNFGQLLATVDSLYSGKMKDSDLKRALQNTVEMDFEKIRDLAKTNKQEAVKYINEMLHKARIASKEVEKSWDGVSSNFVNAWTDIQAELQKPLFDAMKVEISNASKYLKDHKKEIIDFATSIRDGIKSALPVIGQLAVAYGALRASSFLGSSISSMGKMATKANVARLGVVGLIGSFVVAQDEVTSFGTAVQKLSDYFSVGFELISAVVFAVLEQIVGAWNTATQRIGAYWDLAMGYIIRASGNLGVPMANMLNRAVIRPFNSAVYAIKQKWADFLNFIGDTNENYAVLDNTNLIDVEGLKENIDAGQKMMDKARETLSKPVEVSQTETKLAELRAKSNLKLFDLIDKANGTAVKKSEKHINEVKKQIDNAQSIMFKDPTNTPDAKESEKARKKESKEREDALKKEAKALDERNKRYREYLELTGNKSELFQLDVSEKMGEFIKSGEYTAQQLSDIYDGMWKKYQDEGKKANKDIALDFTKQFEGLFEGLFNGNVGDAIKGFMEGVSMDLMKNMISDISTSFQSGIGSLFGGLGSFGQGMIGLGLGLLSNFLSSEVSQEEIDASKGRVEFSDESLKNLASMFESVQYPMLEITNKMHKHIRNMDANFYSVARSLSADASAGGVDITGVNFVDTASSGFLGFSSKAISLIGSGLKFAVQDLGDVMSEASMNVQAYTTTLVQKSSWWGLKKSSKIKETYKDLPPEVSREMADAFANGYEMIMTAGVSLGLNEANLSKLLQNSDISLGKIDFTGLSPEEVSERLNQAFSGALSGVVNGISDFNILVNRYAQNTEDSLQTIVRLATEYDQSSHVFGLIGKTFKNGVIDVERTWTTSTQVLVGAVRFFGMTIGGEWQTVTTTLTEMVRTTYTAQMQMLDIVESAGGLQSFQDAMNAFMTGFYNETEQLNFLTKSMQESFKTLGIAMPKTDAEFRRLLETMDTSTEAGSYLYGQVLLLAESFNAMTDASDRLAEEQARLAKEQADETARLAKEQADTIKNMIKSISDAWLGNLSYLTLQQKADYASGYFKLAKQSDGQLDTVESARLMAETALKSTATKEEYIPIFDKYIIELKNQMPKSTLDDVVLELKNLAGKLDKLEETTREIA